MDLSDYIAVPEWKQFIRLGEQILDLPKVSDRCRLIERIVTQHLHCEAKVWLVEPYYPLPEEDDVQTIPSTPVKEIIGKAYETRKILYQEEPDGATKRFTEPCQARVIAYPVISKDVLMAVLYVERLGQPFCEDDWKFLDGFLTMVALALEVSRQVALKNWRAKQLGLVQTVSEQIANMTDLDHLCSTVTDLIHNLFEFYYVAIYIYDEDQTQLVLRAMQHHSNCGDFTPAAVIQSGQGIIGDVAKNGRELLATDVQNEPRYRYIDCLPETRSELALPLKTEDRIFGVLDLQSDRANGFHANDMVVLRALANNIALAIESTDLYQNLQQRINQIATVVEFSQALTSILDLEDLLEKVSQLIHDRFRYPYVHVFTYHPVRRKVLFGTGVGAHSQAMRENNIAYDVDDPHGIVPWVARHKKTFLSNDIAREPLFRRVDFLPNTIQSELSVPLQFAGEMLGVLDLQSNRKNAFKENDVALVEALASTVAIAIRNANLYRSEKWRVQVADSFREVSELISGNSPLEEILEEILRKLEQNLPCDGSAIWLLDETSQANELGQNNLRLAATHGIDNGAILSSLNDEQVHRMLTDALARQHPTIRQPSDPYGPLGMALGFPPDYSSIAAPLRAGNDTLGIITLAHHTPGRYGSEAHDMTATFASYAAVAIQNARLFEEAQEQAWVSTVLLQVSEASQAISTVDELLTTMVRLPPLLIGVRLSAVFLWMEEDEAFHLKNWYGLQEEPELTRYTEYDATAFTRLTLTRAPVFITDIAEELLIPRASVPEEVGAMVMVPLISRGNLLGAFLVGYQKRALASKNEDVNQQILAILQGISHQTAVALENLKLEESQEEEAYVTAVLLEVAQAVVSQNELDDVLETIVHLMPILVGIDTCVIYLWNRADQIYQPVQAYAGNDEDEIHLLEQVYAPGAFALLDTALASDHLHFSASRSSLPIDLWASLEVHPEEALSQSTIYPGGSILLSVPLSAKGEVFGIMLAKEAVSTLAFQEKRMEIITGIAQQVALAIQNEKYKQDLVETQRMEQEFELARQSQRTFLPAELPRLYRWELDARWIPARQVGGDFYDIIQLDKDRIGLVIADVADKGMAAALYMTVTRTLIRAYSQEQSSPAVVLENVNNMLMPDSNDSMFITAVYAILNKRTNKITYANAGHNLPLIVRRGQEIVSLEKGGISLGVLENIQLVDHEITIQPGDILLLYTDGITEAFNPDNEAYGDERLHHFLLDHHELAAPKLLDRLEEAVRTFAGDNPASDDVTLVCLKRQG